MTGRVSDPRPSSTDNDDSIQNIYNKRAGHGNHQMSYPYPSQVLKIF
jgi:hypothetical protein